ncbi:MAG: DUF58 domain-containing protein [Nitrospiria bacterium]
MKPLKLSYKSKSLVVTSLGMRFIFLMLAIGIAAINTGNNLLYLLLAMMLSLVVISGILSEASLYRLRFKRLLPEAIYAGKPASVTLLIYNDKTSTSSFSLHVKDSIEGFSEGMARDKYFFKLPPGTFQERSYAVFFNKRGVFPLQGVSFSTRFPFGIFLKIREEREAGQTRLVVFPRTFPIESSVKETGRPGAPMALRRGQSGSLYQFRSYLPGDDARFIHWKVSAKKTRLMVREYEDEEEKEISVGLSNTAGEALSKEVLTRFEKGIELAASFSRFYIELGYRVSFFSDQGQIPPGKGSRHLKEILTFLAFMRINHQKEPLSGSREPATVPTLFISPLRPFQSGSRSHFKIFQPEDIDRLSYWGKE